MNEICYGGDVTQKEFKFDGHDYDLPRDYKRLSTQLEAILNLMIDSQWRTLEQIALKTGAPHASVSAQLRNLRKKKNGGYIIDRQYLDNGLYQYRLRIPMMFEVKR